MSDAGCSFAAARAARAGQLFGTADGLEARAATSARCRLARRERDDGGAERSALRPDRGERRGDVAVGCPAHLVGRGGDVLRRHAVGADVQEDVAERRQRDDDDGAMLGQRGALKLGVPGDHGAIGARVRPEMRGGRPGHDEVGDEDVLLKGVDVSEEIGAHAVNRGGTTRRVRGLVVAPVVEHRGQRAPGEAELEDQPVDLGWRGACDVEEHDARVVAEAEVGAERGAVELTLGASASARRPGARRASSAMRRRRKRATVVSSAAMKASGGAFPRRRVAVRAHKADVHGVDAGRVADHSRACGGRRGNRRGCLRGGAGVGVGRVLLRLPLGRGRKVLARRSAPCSSSPRAVMPRTPDVLSTSTLPAPNSRSASRIGESQSPCSGRSIGDDPDARAVEAGNWEYGRSSFPPEGFYVQPRPLRRGRKRPTRIAPACARGQPMCLHLRRRGGWKVLDASSRPHVDSRSLSGR